MKGPILLMVAAVAAIVGTFRELYGMRFKHDAGIDGWSQNGWWYVTNDIGFAQEATPPQVGLPITGSAVVLAVGAVFLLRKRKSGWLFAVGGAAALAAAVWSTHLNYLSMVSGVTEDTRTTEFGPEVFLRDGMYLLLAAVVIAAVGVVFSRPRKEQEPEEEVVIHQIEDLDTPPYGVPMQEKQ